MKRRTLFPVIVMVSLLCLTLSSGFSRTGDDHRRYEITGLPGSNPDDTTHTGFRKEGEMRPVPGPRWVRPTSPPEIMGTYVVTTVADTGTGTLRRAIDSANANPGLDLIRFNIPGTGVRTIVLLTQLPNVTGPIDIDGTTQPGYAGVPIVELNGMMTASGGLILEGGNSRVRGLLINRFPSTGIALLNGGGNVIQGNYIGVDASGTLRRANGGNGIFVNSPVNIIGGVLPTERNVISGNALPGIGIVGTGGDTVRGNYIGVNASGTDVIGNVQNGIFINAPNNIIGGVLPGERNVISGNEFPGIGIGTFGNGNVIRGNYIGTDATGDVDLGNLSNGVIVEGGSNNTIGDTTAAGRNIISGNDLPQISIVGPSASGNRVIGNFIGTDVTATVGLGDGNGVRISNAPNNTIGGTTAGERNIISGNPFPAVFIDGASATANRVLGNYIGTDSTGTVAIGNGKGIVIDGAPRNAIGDGTIAGKNVIAASASYGIEIRNPGATGNKIFGNSIGTDLYGGLDFGSGSVGVLINNAFQDTILYNLIAYNRSDSGGVYIAGGTGNLILGNSIYANTGLGIDLAPRGLTINDPLDIDGGPNNLQNFPILDSARVSGSNLIVSGRYNGSPNAPFHIDFYSSREADSSHFGEAESYLSAGFTGTTDLVGNATFSATFPFSSPDKFITATATDAAGNTSEFSQALCLSDIDGDGILDSWETEGWGIDYNSDGIIDQDLFAQGARPKHKDIFVEVDAMFQLGPSDTTLQRVVDAFNIVPNRLVNNPDSTDGIKLHVTLSDTTLGRTPWFTNWWTFFQVYKDLFFGTQAERDSPNKENILAAKRLVYRYCIFADRHDTSGNSGRSESADARGCDDFMVTMGGWPVDGGNANQRAGTFMHELGHTLGLRHGGPDDKNYKPNYISIMNYTWQMPFKWANTWRLNYSPEALPSLSESSLDETVGLDPRLLTTLPIIAVPYSDPTRQLVYALLDALTPVDWNQDGDSSGTVNPVAVDLNVFKRSLNPSPNETLRSQEDWSKLVYNFRNSTHFPGASPTEDEEMEEMTPADFDFLDNLPPPKPHGVFVMDGVPDTSAVLVASNGQINLYARYKNGQLYVATNSAVAEGADMLIFVSDDRLPLRPAPLGKAGQVARWSVVLAGESSDNSSGWYDGNGVPFAPATASATGGILEGVVDVGLLYGRRPDRLFIAVGKYGTNDGGTLITQVPSGNGDGNIDPTELFQLLGTVPPQTEFTQQGGKLVGAGVSGIAAQGVAVSLSADGNTAIVGGYADNSNVGASWVFSRTGTAWTQQGNKLVGSGGVGASGQGYSVDLSSDGNTAIVGGNDDNGGVGAAWVFVRNNGVWTQQGSKLVGTGASGIPRQGTSVAISGDGSTALVGGFSDQNFVGAAWVFTRTNGVWSQQGAKLVGSDGVVHNTYQGGSVALSFDGNTAFIGGSGDSAGQGAVWAFVRNAGVWSQQGNKIVGTGGVNRPGQGTSVGLSSDGNAAIVGGPIDNGGVGAVWFFKRMAGVWTQQGSKIVATGAVGPANLGASVSLSSDGAIALAGGPQDDGSAGAAWVFRRNGEIWSQQGSKLVGADVVGPALQGTSVGLSSDGGTAIVGGLADDGFNGAAWVFFREQPLPIQLASFTARRESHGVVLEWVTSGETNNYGFEMERSEEIDNNYATLPNSFRPGHGTTTEPHHYEFLDSTTHPGQWYYRLRQIDLDGTIHHTEGIAINTLTGVPEDALPKHFDLGQNYPNPFNPVTTIRFALPVESFMTLKIYNVLGQEVATLVSGPTPAGNHAVRFDASALASGVYLYEIRARDYHQTRKMMIVR